MKLVVAAAVLMANALLFSAGWLIGAFAGTPAAPPSRRVIAADRPRIFDIPRIKLIELRPTPRPKAQPPSIDTIIQTASRRHGVSAALIRAVAKVESDFDPREVSNKGARGLMQVMPETGRRFGVTADRLFDPVHNIAAGTAYLAWLLDRYDDNLDLTLAAYNAGEGAVDQYRGIPPYRETQTYVRRVRSVLAEMERPN